MALRIKIAPGMNCNQDGNTIESANCLDNRPYVCLELVRGSPSILGIIRVHKSILDQHVFGLDQEHLLPFGRGYKHFGAGIRLRVVYDRRTRLEKTREAFSP